MHNEDLSHTSSPTNSSDCSDATLCSATLPTSEARPETLAEMLLWLPKADQRRELDVFRQDYEAIHGPTDLTPRYTSTWPKAQQDWLMEHDLRRWFDGLPPFAKAYLRGKLEMAARQGNLDDAPADFLALYVAGQLKLDDDAQVL